MKVCLSELQRKVVSRLEHLAPRQKRPASKCRGIYEQKLEKLMQQHLFLDARAK